MELVEIAIFSIQDDARVLESILQSESVSYFLSNENMSVFSPAISRSLMVREEDKVRVVEIIKEAGFENYLTE
jgi:hypothetical protein